MDFKVIKRVVNIVVQEIKFTEKKDVDELQRYNFYPIFRNNTALIISLDYFPCKH